MNIYDRIASLYYKGLAMSNHERDQYYAYSQLTFTINKKKSCLDHIITNVYKIISFEEVETLLFTCY